MVLLSKYEDIDTTFILQAIILTDTPFDRHILTSYLVHPVTEPEHFLHHDLLPFFIEDGNNDARRLAYTLPPGLTHSLIHKLANRCVTLIFYSYQRTMLFCKRPKIVPIKIYYSFLQYHLVDIHFSDLPLFLYNLHHIFTLLFH